MGTAQNCTSPFLLSQTLAKCTLNNALKTENKNKLLLFSMEDIEKACIFGTEIEAGIIERDYKLTKAQEYVKKYRKDLLKLIKETP